MKIITSKDPRITAATYHIQENTTQQDHFGIDIDFLLMNVTKNRNSSNSEHRVSGLKSSKGGKGGKEVKKIQRSGGTGVNLCYHRKFEYLNMTRYQKKELREWRKKEGDRYESF